MLIGDEAKVRLLARAVALPRPDEASNGREPDVNVNGIRRGGAVLAALALAATGCGGGGGGGSTQDPEPAPTLKILARGGKGTTGPGGSGGPISISAAAGSDVRVLATGSVDASFHRNLVPPDLGPNPLTVAAAQTLTPDAAGALVGDDGASPATGLWVKPGATLTLLPNVDWDGVPGLETVRLVVPGGLWVEGALTVGLRADSTVDASDLRVAAGAAVLAGRLDLSGLAATTPRGGHAGNLFVEADGGIQLAGVIRAVGGDGDKGGNGGIVSVYSALYGLWSTADITTSGGAGSASAGGDAGWIELLGSGSPGGSGSWGGAFSAGKITARGGPGASAGGKGASVYVAGYYNGSIVSSSDIDTSGGAATVDGSGGGGGWVSLKSWTGELRVAGTIVTRGGAAAGTMTGGNGGGVYLALYDDDQTFGGLYVGAARIGAAIDTSGGDGATGGAGAEIIVDLYPSAAYQPGAHVLELVGYAGIDASGGSGATGGEGGDLLIQNDLAWTAGATPVIGGIRVEVPLTTAGGAGDGGDGGRGGDVNVYTYYVHDPSGTTDNGVPSYDRSTTVTAPIVTSGGDGAGGGQAGGILLYDRMRVSAPALTAAGGRGSAGTGGAGGTVEVMSDVQTELGGAIQASGGDGTTSGGAAGQVSAWGLYTRVAGDLSANGGACTAGTGGDGGRIDLVASGSATSFKGTASVRGGAGASAGATGTVRLDGTPVALTDGAFKL